MIALLHDLRYALRALRKSPLFTSIAVLSLALGIGANTAIFTLVDQLILQQLPVRHPEQLVLLTGRGRHYGSNNGPNAISYLMYTDFRDRNQVFSGMFCRMEETFSLGFEGKTQLIAGESVSGNYFPVLGVGAAVGRVFNSSDDLYQGAHPLAVLSYAFWKTRFGGDPAIVGRKIVVNGYPLTVIGVSQSGFDGVNPGYSPQIRIPITMHDTMSRSPNPELGNRRRRFIQAFGRMKPGVTLATAKSSLQPIFHQTLQMEVVMPAFSKASAYTKKQFLTMWMDLLPASKGRSDLREQFSKPLVALMAVVGLVLLIACTNVANLLIARASARQKEIAVRLALGAGRVQLVRQLLVESLLLSLVSGAVGVGLAVVLDRTLVSFLPSSTSQLSISTLPDWRVLLFTLAISLVTGVLFGLVPAWQSTRPQLAATLKDQAGAVVHGGPVKLRKGLVVAQVALSMLLLIGAGLFLASLKNLKDLNPGFDASHLVAFGVEPTLGPYDLPRGLDYYRRLNERVSNLGGVSSASLAVMPLLYGYEWDSSITVEGYTAKEGEMVDPHMQFCSAGFFDTLKIPVLRGRAFTTRDERGAPKVAIVNQKFAKRYFGAADPIGRHVGMGSNPGTPTDIEIVGVVGDTKYESMRQEVPYEMYLPYRQVNFINGMMVYARVRGDEAGILAMLPQVVREVDAGVPLYDLRTVDQQVENSLVTERLLATLSAGFGVLATLLAAIGLYGVMAYMVARRTREIGIRMALGASGGSVAWMVMREVLLLAGVGVGFGLLTALWVTRLVAAQLFGVEPADPSTLILAAAGIAAVAMVSGYLPARRATAIDPMRALRWE